MEPSSSVPTIGVQGQGHVKEAPEKKKKEETEPAVAPDAEKAQGQQQIFEAGATAGGVVRLTMPETPALVKIPAKEFIQIRQMLADVVSATINDQKMMAGILAYQIFPELVAEGVRAGIAQAESMCTKEQLALNQHLADKAVQTLRPLLSGQVNELLRNAPDEAILMVAKQLLGAKVAAVCEAIQKIHPAYVQNLIAIQASPQLEMTSCVIRDTKTEIVAKELEFFQQIARDPRLLPAIFTKVAPQTPPTEPSAEENALFRHLANYIYVEYKSKLEVLGVPVDESDVRLAIESVLRTKISSFTQEIAKISPEYLQQLVDALPYEKELTTLALLVQKLQQSEPNIRGQLREALTAEDADARESFFIANQDNALLREVSEFLKSVPTSIVGSMRKGLIDGISK